MEAKPDAANRIERVMQLLNLRRPILFRIFVESHLCIAIVDEVSFVSQKDFEQFYDNTCRLKIENTHTVPYVLDLGAIENQTF